MEQESTKMQFARLVDGESAVVEVNAGVSKTSCKIPWRGLFATLLMALGAFAMFALVFALVRVGLRDRVENPTEYHVGEPRRFEINHANVGDCPAGRLQYGQLPCRQRDCLATASHQSLPLRERSLNTGGDFRLLSDNATLLIRRSSVYCLKLGLEFRLAAAERATTVLKVNGNIQGVCLAESSASDHLGRCWLSDVRRLRRGDLVTVEVVEAGVRVLGGSRFSSLLLLRL